MNKRNSATLSNQALALLSQLTHKIRGSAGVIKVSDIVNDQQYAFEIFVQSVLSDDDELVNLTQVINNELKVEQHLINALGAYFKDFKLRAKSKEVLENNKAFLIKLVHYMVGVNVTGLAYRQAVNELIANVEESQKHFCVDIARSFYPYWVNASNALSLKRKTEEIATKSQKETLMDLWHEIEAESLSISENRMIRQYADAMRALRLGVKEMEVRIKIAKVILVELRQFAQTSDGYRDNIDTIQQLITSTRLKDYILEVSREFYPFCLNPHPSE
jgi:hypothetical protein